MKYFILDKGDWDKTLEKLLTSYNIYATISDEYNQDYELLTARKIPEISYNKPKPVTPLKSFFLPVKENVTSPRNTEKPRIILGAPNCDIVALDILDEIYLDENFHDIFYSQRRENTVLISSDCFGTLEHCHCSSYNIKPYSDEKADIAIIYYEGEIILRIISVKGESLITNISEIQALTNDNIISFINKKHEETEKMLLQSNLALPDYKTTVSLVHDSGEEIWVKHSSTCVACGACATICPTCSCFLLIDKPGFHKVKQMDACQYPGFERVAGGEDTLHQLHNRFRNRYMCKYVWKPAKFKSLACTGCGRCIEACIGKINKNELFMELAK